MRRKKIVTIFWITLFDFGYSFLTNVLFNKMDVNENLMDSFMSCMMIMILFAIFYNPASGQNEDFWRRIRESIGKKSEDV